MAEPTQDSNRPYSVHLPTLGETFRHSKPFTKADVIRLAHSLIMRNWSKAKQAELGGEPRDIEFPPGLWDEKMKEAEEHAAKATGDIVD